MLMPASSKIILKNSRFKKWQQRGSTGKSLVDPYKTTGISKFANIAIQIYIQSSFSRNNGISNSRIIQYFPIGWNIILILGIMVSLWIQKILRPNKVCIYTFDMKYFQSELKQSNPELSCFSSMCKSTRSLEISYEFLEIFPPFLHFFPS